MNLFMSGLSALSDILWGPAMLVLLSGTGIYLTLGLRFYTFRHLITAFRILRQGKTHGAEHGELSPFNALMTALAGTIGTGSIVGVATAILAGGPGALFWMWCMSLIGMATKFSEILLAMHFREVTPSGNVVGGAMYFIRNGLGPRWRWLGGFFALFTAISCFGTGNMVQANAISGVLHEALHLPPWVSALGLFLLMAAVILGGVQRIGTVAGRIVPLMVILYLLASICILLLNITHLPAAFFLVLDHAFTPAAAAGGFSGATVMMAIRYGMARGVFANEAGLGSSPIAHATATASPIRQATVGMLDVFITTIIVCSMTGFSILVTGQWLMDGAQGARLTAQAFESALPGFGAYIVALALVFFAFTTILAWCVYGERSVIYLFGDRSQLPFRVLFTFVAPLGALINLDFVWLMADVFNALMAIPNLIGLLLLSPVVFQLVRDAEKE